MIILHDIEFWLTLPIDIPASEIPIAHFCWFVVNGLFMVQVMSTNP